MAITLDAINKVVLRRVFLPWFREQMISMAIPLLADWNPSDAELEWLAERCGAAMAEYETGGR